MSKIANSLFTVTQLSYACELLSLNEHANEKTTFGELPLPLSSGDHLYY
jgi:hypothetical protein